MDAGRQRLRIAAAVVLCMVLALWVHGRSLATFFTSPDDIVYLEEASGLVPTPHKVFRFLSEILYFRVMIRLAGLDPLPYHAVTMLLHLANIALVFRFARSQGAAARTAVLGAALFGVFPLFSTVLSSAVGINDQLALALALSALLALGLRGIAGVAVPVVCFALAMLSKESVIFFPWLAVLSPARDPIRTRVVRAAPLLGVSVASLALLMLVRPIRVAPDPAVYVVHFGWNILHNLMTYASWSVNVMNPLPDIVSSYDPRAWQVGIWVFLGALASSRVFGRAEPAIPLGTVWYVLGLLPVIPLASLTYRHYLYPAFPGLALVVAGTLLHALEWLARRAPQAAAPVRGPSWLATAVAVAFVLSYAVAASWLVERRFTARVPGTELALDPVFRRQELAGQAIASLDRQLRPENDRMGILLPEGTERVFGARSGREYRHVPEGRKPYDLLEEALDHGRAVRLFFPWVDSVAFITRWNAGYRDFELYAPAGGGSLQAMGSGPAAHGQVATWMMQHRWYEPARDHLRSALEVYPTDAGLRLGYGAALFRTGDRAGAIAQLETIVREAPGDSNAVLARQILAKLDTTVAKSRAR